MTPSYIHIYPLFFRFFSHIGHYSVLSRVPCALQQVLVYFIYRSVYMLIQIYPFLLPPLVIMNLFSMSVSFCFVSKFICIESRISMKFSALWHSYEHKSNNNEEISESKKHCSNRLKRSKYPERNSLCSADQKIKRPD